MRTMLVGLVLSVLFLSSGVAQDDHAFLKFIRQQAATLREDDAPPSDAAAWQARRESIRQQMARAFGEFPSPPASLEPRLIETLQRDGYRIEKLLLQTFPGIWMPALAYVPDGPGPHPAILHVHGHWKGAKQDPAVQARCLGAARHGFFSLAVDAFGAGERAIGKGLGEYHGEMVAATLLPTGHPLVGIQVYENMRAVDYLMSRPEVDPKRIGITGASGGGNQTMYAFAWDERLQAGVSTCSVGNYQAYLGAACCMCEVLPGALRFTEEWGVLGQAGPNRRFMAISATRDARQFSVDEARKSISAARQLPGQGGSFQHAIFESQHDYNQPMRETMYRFMTDHLKGIAGTDPLVEGEIQTLDPEVLRCFPGNSRPDDWVTLPQFAGQLGHELVARWQQPTTSEGWSSRREQMVERLQASLGGFPAATDLMLSTATTDAGTIHYTFSSEPGITLTAERAGGEDRVAVLLDLAGAEHARASPQFQQLRNQGWSVITVDLRATGSLAWPSDAIGRAPDHNTAEWSLWIGRPLIGQWVYDIRRLVDALGAAGVTQSELAVVGIDQAGPVALMAAAFEPRLQRVAVLNTLGSYVTDAPYQHQRLGILVPGILRDVGDIPHLAALVAPRSLTIQGTVTSQGAPLDNVQQHAAWQATAAIYSLWNQADRLSIRTGESEGGPF